MASATVQDRVANETCPVCATADIICSKWTMLVIRDLADGSTRFSELERSLAGISPRTLSLRLRALEDEGDRLMHESIGELFRSGAEPLAVIRWKDIHEGLEEAVDACENAADVLEAILAKNR